MKLSLYSHQIIKSEPIHKNCSRIFLTGSTYLGCINFHDNFLFMTDLVLIPFLYEAKRLLYITKSVCRPPSVCFTLLYAQKQVKALYLSFCLEPLKANFEQTFLPCISLNEHCFLNLNLLGQYI